MESNNHQEFFEELREVFENLRDIIDKHGLERQVCSALLIGIIENDEENGSALRMSADFMVANEDELDVLLSSGVQVYQQAVSDLEQEDMGQTWMDAASSEGWGIDDWMDFINEKNDDNE